MRVERLRETVGRNIVTFRSGHVHCGLGAVLETCGCGKKKMSPRVFVSRSVFVDLVLILKFGSSNYDTVKGHCLNSLWHNSVFVVYLNIFR